MAEAWIIDGTRSPRGKGKANGSLHHIHPQELLAQVLNALARPHRLRPADVDDVIIGNGNSAGDHGACIGRMAVLAAGWPVEAPGVTLNRFCGSGQQAITFAAMGIQAGHQQLVVGGGVESMSRWPIERRRRPTSRPATPRCASVFPLVPQGISADLIATIEGFTRDDVDALRRSEPAARRADAMAEGRFDRSVVPIRNADGSRRARPRRVPAARHARSRRWPSSSPSFAKMGAHVFEGSTPRSTRCAARCYPQIERVDHVHHAGNSSGVVDGAERRAAGLARLRQGARPARRGRGSS